MSVFTYADSIIKFKNKLGGVMPGPVAHMLVRNPISGCTMSVRLVDHFLGTRI